MSAVPPPPAPDWEAVPPTSGAYGPPAYQGYGAPSWGNWTPPPPREPARPVGAERTRTVLVALVGAVAGAAVAAVVVSMIYLAGARETGEAMGEEIGDQLAEEFGFGGGIYTDPLPTPGASGPVEQTAPVTPGVLGPDPVLDAYAQQCFAGDLQSCDDLYYSAAPGSDYEEYGTSCGGRVAPGAVYSCTELD